MTAEVWLITIIVNLAIAAVAAFGGAYWTEKGKGLAIKQDIEKLTQTVESIKAEHASQLAQIVHQQTVLIEQARFRHQIRIASMDRRLQAHQEAFTLWRQMLKIVHNEGDAGVIGQCQKWWEENCVYLEADVRDAFNRAYFAVADHKTLLNVQQRGESEIRAVQENWKLIMSTGDIILKAVELPALNEREQKLTPNTTIS
jgi:hypothetical protein